MLWGWAQHNWHKHANTIDITKYNVLWIQWVWTHIQTNPLHNTSKERVHKNNNNHQLIGASFPYIVVLQKKVQMLPRCVRGVPLIFLGLVSSRILSFKIFWIIFCSAFAIIYSTLSLSLPFPLSPLPSLSPYSWFSCKALVFSIILMRSLTKTLRLL